MLKISPSKPAKEEVEARRHRRIGIGEGRRGSRTRSSRRVPRRRGSLGHPIVVFFRHDCGYVPCSPNASNERVPLQLSLWPRSGLKRPERPTPLPSERPVVYSLLGSSISPGFIASAISRGVQRPPSSDFVMPRVVTTFISAMRPPPQKKVFPVISLDRSLAR